MKIVFVCSSNICRSPYCEIMMQRMIENDKDLASKVKKVSSAAMLNRSFKINPKAVLSLRREGFSDDVIYAHKPRFKIAAWKDLKEADLIIGMNNANKFFTPLVFKKKFRTLSEVAENKYKNIPDPWLMKDMNDYYAVMDILKDYLNKFVERIKRGDSF